MERVRPKRAQVKNACVNCQRACKKCDNSRPCQRCIRYNLKDTCEDSKRKPRQRGIKRGPYKKRVKNNLQDRDVHSLPPPDLAYETPSKWCLDDSERSESPLSMLSDIALTASVDQNPQPQYLPHLVPCYYRSQRFTRVPSFRNIPISTTRFDSSHNPSPQQATDNH